MHSLTLLVVCLYLNSATSSPLPDADPINEIADASFQQTVVPSAEKDTLSAHDPPAQPIKVNLALKRSEIDSPEDSDTFKGSFTTPPEDMMEQETFYPGGGIWWGFRPWGGWGSWGYRPGWHGWHGWYRPHWGGNWGGHWGGGRWR